MKAEKLADYEARSDLLKDRVILVTGAGSGIGASLARRSAKLGATVVLKGAGTVVAAPEHPVAINLTGNPGMASGGSGDVLAGIIVGLAGQGIPPFEASCAAVWLHGRAADLAAAEKSQISIIACDLIEKLPEAFRALSCR